jgi:hypothetical protein
MRRPFVPGGAAGRCPYCCEHLPGEACGRIDGTERIQQLSELVERGGTRARFDIRAEQTIDSLALGIRERAIEPSL